MQFRDIAVIDFDEGHGIGHNRPSSKFCLVHASPHKFVLNVAHSFPYKFMEVVVELVPFVPFRV